MPDLQVCLVRLGGELPPNIRGWVERLHRLGRNRPAYRIKREYVVTFMVNTLPWRIRRGISMPPRAVVEWLELQLGRKMEGHERIGVGVCADVATRRRATRKLFAIIDRAGRNIRKSGITAAEFDRLADEASQSVRKVAAGRRTKARR